MANWKKEKYLETRTVESINTEALPRTYGSLCKLQFDPPYWQNEYPLGNMLSSSINSFP